MLLSTFFVFFQEKDGIRDICVTGVQTCALPICSWAEALSPPLQVLRIRLAIDAQAAHAAVRVYVETKMRGRARVGDLVLEVVARVRFELGAQIGRASCRERVEI